MKSAFQLFHRCAKHTLPLVLFFLFTGQVSLAEQIDIGIFESSAPNKMEIRIKPDFTINATDNLSGIIYTVRWNNPDIVITSVDYIFPFNVMQLDPLTLVDGFYYQIFGSTPGVAIGSMIPAGTEKVISSFSYTGSGDVCFEIINDEWTWDNNGDVYFEFNGTDHTGIIYEPTAPEGCFMGPCTLELTCPGNISVPPDAGSCGAVVTYSAPVIGGTCPDAILTQTAGLPSGSLFPAGTTTNSFQATSAQAEEPVSCSFTVTVNSLPGAAGNITGTTPVCQGQSGVSYSVAPITNATSYVWTYTGTGATIIGNSTTVTVNYGPTATSGNLKVYGTNACGNGPVSPNYPVTVNPLPGAAGSITGPSSVCQGQNNVFYSVPSIPNATSYVWSYSGTGATINGTGRTVPISFSPGATSGDLTVSGVNACGTGAPSPGYSITVNNLPGAAGTITGTTPVCQGQTGVGYSVTPIPNATSYFWSYSGTGATIIGSGPSVTVNFALSATSGNLTVRGVNVCGQGTSSPAYPITINPLPGAAGTITGTTPVCQGQTGVAYSVAAIPNATSYVWTYTGAGATINGSGNSITIDFSASATSGNLTVSGVNACGNGASSLNFAITVNGLPGAAGTITGPATVCQGQSGVTYSVAPVTYASSYVWSYSGTGATINGTTNSVTVSFSQAATPGDLTVYATNNCGNGAASPPYAIAIDPLPEPAGTITGTTPVCQGQTGVGYSVTPIPGATSYFWSYSGTGATITGTTNSVTISFAVSATSGNLTVSGVNSCGQGASSPAYPITINPLPGAAGPITGTTPVCQGQTGVAYSVAAIPNATSYVWTYTGTGATINGSGTSITIDFSASATSGNLTVRGNNACGNGALSPSYPITVNGLPGAAGTITGAATVCQGQSGVAYSVAPVTYASSYVWSYSGTGATINGTTSSITVSFSLAATPGNLTVYATNNCGNGAASPPYAIAIDPLPGPAGTIAGTTPVCQGQTGVGYSVTPIPGATSYFWSYSGTGATITGTNNSVTVSFAVSATSGNLTVRGVNSCGQGASSPAYPITINPLPGAAGTIAGTTPVCQGATDVVYGVTAIPNATSYVWTYTGTGATINGTGNSITISFSPAATSGNLTVYGTNLCGDGGISPDYSILIVPLPAAPVSGGDQEICSGDDIPALTVTVGAGETADWYANATGGTPLASGTLSYTPGAAGTFYAEARNLAAGCLSPSRTAVTLIVHPLPAVYAGADQSIPNGTSTTITDATATGTAVLQYAWTPEASFVDPGVLHPATVNLYATNTYTLTVTDGDGCINSDQMTITVTGSALAVNPTASPDELCSGEVTQLSSNASGGSGTYTYTWTSDPAGFTSAQANPEATPAVTTTYHVEVNDGFTTATGTVEVVVYPNPAAPVSGGDQEICSGDDIPALTVTVGAGETADWYANPSGGTPLASGTLSYTPGAAGTYYAEARNLAAGCLSPSRTTVTLIVHPLPAVYAGADQSIPNGTSTTITDATATGTAVLQYAWTPEASFVDPGVLHPATVNLYASNTYTLTVTDGDGCINSDQMTITVTGSALAVNPTASPDELCSGEVTQLSSNASGGSGTYTYTWTSDPAGFTSAQANPEATPAVTTTYHVEVNDGFTTATGTVEVVVYPNPAAPVSGGDQEICSGDDIPALTVTVGAGETADWYANPSGGTPLASGTLSYTPGTAGTYYAEARNLAAGCLSPSRTAVTLIVHPLPAVYAGADQSIPNGTSTTITDATATGTAVLQYAWTPAASFVDPGVLNPTTINLYATNTYTLTVTDGDGCINSDQMTITVTGSALAVNPTATPDELCSGEGTQLSSNASGGSGTYTYTWTSDPAGFTSAQANPEATPAVTTTYHVEVNDGFTTATGTVEVVVYPNPAAPVSGGDQEICSGDDIPALTVTVGAGETADWYANPSGGTPLASGTLSYTPGAAGTYHAEARNLAAGCLSPSRTAVTLIVHPLPAVYAGADQSIYTGTSTTITDATATGTAVLQYAWTPAASFVDPGVLNPTTINLYATNTYTLTVTDGDGCINSDQMSITVTGPELGVNPSATPDAICPGEGMQLFANASGGSGDYGYSWTSDPAGFTSSQANPLATPLTTTTYTVVVDDGYGNASGDITVTVYPIPEVFAGADRSIPYGTSVTISDATASGPEPLSYAWTPAGAFVDATALNPTTVNLNATTVCTLTVTDANGCINSEEMTITVTGSSLSVDPFADPAGICPGGETQLFANATGGSGYYTYSWTSEPAGFTSTQANPPTSSAVTTTYHVVVQDGYNSASGTVLVTVYALPDVFAGADQAIPLGASTIIGDATASGADPLSYSWTPAATFVDPAVLNAITVNLTSAVTCTLEVTDGHGCQQSDWMTITVTGTELELSVAADPYTLCTGETTQLTATVTGGSGNYLYSWISTPSGFTSSLSNPQDSPAVTTGYTVVVDDGYSTVSGTLTVVMADNPEVTCPAELEVLLTDPAFVLTGGLPAGGTYSGDGVSGGNFDPAAAGAGEHTITYTFEDLNGCTGSCTFLITVSSALSPGDANCDGIVNVLDVITIVNYIMELDPDPFCFDEADVNDDLIINVMDVIGTVNIIMAP